MTLAITAAIIYTVVNSKIGQVPNQIQSTTAAAPSAASSPAVTTSTAQVATSPEMGPPEMEGNFIEKSLSKLLVNILKTPEGRTFFENLIQPVDKPMTGDGASFKLDNNKLIDGIFKIRTAGEVGLGPASCGHFVTVHYQIINTNNAVIEDATKTIKLGAGDAIPAIENIAVGMYVGQTREGYTSPRYAFVNQKFQSDTKKPGMSYKIKLHMLDIEPKTFIAPGEVKVFDDEISYQMPYLCGERVTCDVKINKVDGTVVYDSKERKQKLDMILGDPGYPMIFSHALFNKIPTGTRTVIARGKYFRSLANKDMNKIFPKEQLPMDDFFLIEFKNFSQDGR